MPSWFGKVNFVPYSKVSDFAVLEWPAEERFRFDQQMLEDPRLDVDMRRRPAVYYRIRDSYQADFEERLERMSATSRRHAIPLLALNTLEPVLDQVRDQLGAAAR